MRKSRFILSIAGFVLAFGIFGTAEASASTHQVKSGDSLWKIAKTYNISIQNIKEWNGLTNDTIRIGQTLTINVPNENKTTEAATEQEAETVKQVEKVDYDLDKLIEVANKAVGTRYKWGGVTPSGFDCSGFIYYVYNQSGKTFNRQSAKGYYDMSSFVETPQIGDLVFFKNTYKSGISHVGVYIGNNEFIHADSKGVMVSNLNEKYWKKHFDSYKRFN